MAGDDSFSVSTTQAIAGSGLDLATLSAGKVIEARVVSIASGMAILAGRFGTIEADLSAVGANKAAVGDLLRLEVRSVDTGDGSSKLTLVERGGTGAAGSTGPTASPNTSVDATAEALAQAVRSAAVAQSGLAPLFATLSGLEAAPEGTVPDGVRTLIKQMMGARIGSDGSPTGASVAKAFGGSGVFLESRIGAGGQVGSGDDLKAGLQALKTALAGWVGTMPARSTVVKTGSSAGNDSIVRLPSNLSPQSAGDTAGQAAPPNESEATSRLTGRLVAVAYGATPATRTGGTPESETTARSAAAAYGGARPAGSAALPAVEALASIDRSPVLPEGFVATTASTVSATPAVSEDPSGVPVTSPAVDLPDAAVDRGAAAATSSGGATASESDGSPVVVAEDAPSGGGVAAPTREAGTLGSAAALAEAILGAVASGEAASTGSAAVVAAAVDFADKDRSLRPPPPRRGQSPRGQAAWPVDAAASGNGEEITGLGRRALQRTEGALQRILLEQYAVLDRPDDDAALSSDPLSRREWSAEMPIATGTGTGVVQMTVEREGRREGAAAGSVTEGWRVRFSLDVEPVGPVHAQIGLSGERMSIGLWIERPEMASLLGAEIGQLRGALEAAAIPVDGVHVATGRPVEPKAKTPSHFIDVSL